MAAKSISSFLWAGVGVALAAQKDFADFMSYSAGKPKFTKMLKDLPFEFGKTVTEVWLSVQLPLRFLVF